MKNEGRLVCGAKIFGISHLNDVIAQFDEAAFTCQKTGMAHEVQMDENTPIFVMLTDRNLLKRTCEVACGWYAQYTALSDLPVQARQ